jgi:hypothetical protein
MAFVALDRANVTSTTTGTGTFTLGSAVSGYVDFSGVGNGNQTYYAITDSTNFEIGIGTYTSSGTTLSRNIVISSTNGDSKVDFAAGTKYVFSPQPSVVMQGGVPTADDSTIGADLGGWKSLQRSLMKSVTAGTTFKNPIPATYDIVLGSTQLYRGGVLTPNGDIHFVPESATGVLGGIVGKKVSASGVVSTYTLLDTAYGGAGGLFWGGVLAPNGDVYFIPHSAYRGQKISASGVLSTYSLVYTSSQAYIGGVVAPNGDIHFVPYNANRGQKISSAGVVSTYSLIYTAFQSYSGGVLAPNGDIHFVPHRAIVAGIGQKISASGVVSTYSLVYTTFGDAYSGGVLAPNGDIHFVPYDARVGQKVSITGVVSTYALVHTSALGARYQGGVYHPNGDIHFVPYRASVGQKISAAGVVSTYSLSLYNPVFYQDSTFIGGTLDFDGNIHFIPYYAGYYSASWSSGLKVYTLARPLDNEIALSPFFNKF